MKLRRTVFSKLVFVLAVLFLTNACADYDVIEGQGEFSNMNQLIIGGTEATAGWYDAVVSLHETARGGNSVYVYPFCSGTLITDSVVLTAAHCLNVAKSPMDVKTMAPSKLMIRIGAYPVADYYAGRFLDGLQVVSETQIHAGYDPIQLINDIALVRLAQPVPESVATPIPALPASEGFDSGDIGERLNFAGFGQDDNGDYGVRLQVDHKLGGLGCSVTGCLDGGDPATQISYTNEIGPCFGDSGGPAFVFRTGGTYVGGITSYGDADCAVYGVSTRVDSYETWIAEFVDGTGGGGGGGSQGFCGDGFCGGVAEGEDCFTCVEDCGQPSYHPKKETLMKCCGNGTCDKREDAASCSVDCLP